MDRRAGARGRESRMDSGSGAAPGGGSRARRLCRFIRVGLGVAVAGAAGAASSHTGPVSIPPDYDYVVRWFQPHSVRPVENWEIEIVPTRNPAQRFVTTAQVAPDDGCWALNVPIGEPATVRVRSVAGNQVSPWTRYTTVPEPSPSTALLPAALLLGAIARRRRA